MSSVLNLNLKPMQSKNKKPPTVAEAAHILRVKLLPCSVCDEGGGESAPSEAHEIKQGQWFSSIALCGSCHRGAKLGLHGERGMWRIKKMDEVDALAVTVKRLMK